MHPLLILDQAQGKVSYLEGVTMDSATVIASESLLADGGARASKIVVFCDVVDDTLRIVLDVSWHDRFGAIDHEEWCESHRSIDGCADSPQY
jgi:hypothetical protein